MKRNVGSQLISAQMISATDGSDVTAGTCNVAVEIDGAAGTGGTATHIANGKWEYAPIQADTNGGYLTFQFVITGAITSTAQVYTAFPQTGDSFARIGASGAGLSQLGGMSTAMKAEVQAEANDALVANNLDHLMALAVTGGDVVDDSVVAKLVSKSATADWDSYVNTTDSLEGIRDNTDALQESISNIGAAAGAALPQEATSDNATVAIKGVSKVGTETGTFTNTEAEDTSYHVLTHAANDIDWIYGFSIGGNKLGASVTFVGYLTSNNDAMLIQAYDFVGADWETIANLTGQNGTTDITLTPDLLSKHTGTGADLGNVYIRFEADGAMSSPVLNVNKLVVNAVSTSQSVGYADGAIWVDTVNGTAGVESYVNGTADNPVDTLADAITLATAIGLSRYRVIAGSTITFAESHDSEDWSGSEWTLALGGQSISASSIHGATVTGICTGASPPAFEHCRFGNVTLPPCRVNDSSGFSGTLTLGSAGDYFIIACTSLVAGVSTPTIDMGAGIAASNLNIRDWSGGLTFNNVEAGDIVSLEGRGGNITVNGTGGAVYIRGIFNGVVDNSSASVTIGQTAMINRTSLVGYEGAAVWVNSNASNTGVIDYIDGTADNPVSTIGAATTVATSLGLMVIEQVRGSSITLAQTYTGFGFIGGGAALALGGQDVSGSGFRELFITGTALGSSQIIYDGCKLTNVTTAQAGVVDCSISGTLTLSSAAVYTINNCFESGDAGGATLDFGAVVGAQHVEIHDWTGSLNVANMLTGDTLHINGNIQELTFNANCTGGATIVAGIMKITNNGAGTVDTDAQYDRAVSDATLVDTGTTIPAAITALNDFDPAADTVVNVANVATLTGHTVQTGDNYARIGVAGAGLTDLGGMSTAMKAEVNTEVVDVLTVDTHAEIGQETPVATQSMLKMLQFMYKTWRNKKDNDGATSQLYNDAGTTVDQKQTTSEAAGTVTKGKWTVGP